MSKIYFLLCCVVLCLVVLSFFVCIIYRIAYSYVRALRTPKHKMLFLLRSCFDCLVDGDGGLCTGRLIEVF